MDVDSVFDASRSGEILDIYGVLVVLVECEVFGFSGMVVGIIWLLDGGCSEEVLIGVFAELEFGVGLMVLSVEGS